MSLFRDNTIRVMKIGKKADGSMGNIQGVLDFPKVNLGFFDTIINYLSTGAHVFARINPSVL